MNVKKRGLLYGGLLLSLAILGGLVYDNWEGLRAALLVVRWGYLGLALLSVFASYALIGLSLWEILRLLGYPLGLLETLGIGFVSTAVNYIVASAGLSGFALKAYLLRRRQVPYGAMVTASVVSSVFFYIVLAILMVQGFVFLLLRSQGTRLEMLEGAAGLGLVVGFAFFLGAAFFHHELRTEISIRVFRAVNHVIYFFSKSEIPREHFEEFDRQIGEGLRKIRSKGWRLALAVGYICADWFFTLLVLRFAFLAVGAPVHPAQLLAGFGVGQLATLVPFLPAGMGAMEGSMAAAFARLGFPFETALAAGLIFRTLYYLLPGGLSLFVYWGLRISEPPHGLGMGRT